MKSAQWRGIRFASVTGSDPDRSATSSVATSDRMASIDARDLDSLGCSAVATACASSSPSHRLSSTLGKPP
eukprot:5439-Chlamydomonas_euryale.AAC.1